MLLVVLRSQILLLSLFVDFVGDFKVSIPKRICKHFFLVFCSVFLFHQHEAKYYKIFIILSSEHFYCHKHCFYCFLMLLWDFEVVGTNVSINNKTTKLCCWHFFREPNNYLRFIFGALKVTTSINVLMSTKKQNNV